MSGYLTSRIQESIMGWFARDRRHKAPAYEIAETLFRMMVEEEFDFADPKKCDVPEQLWPEFRAKARLYREATVLMLLLPHAEKEAKYEEVWKSYEGMILPNTPTPDGMTKLEALRTAMRHINSLVRERREMSWSMTWLEDIGHTETNPVTLALFATFWMDFYIAAAKSLADLRPT